MLCIWKSVDDVLDYAIENEQKAVLLYRDLLTRSSRPKTKELFEHFAREEEGHRDKLLAMKQDGSLVLSGRKLAELSQQLEPCSVPESGIDIDEAFRLAIKSEQEARAFYLLLADFVSGAEIRDVFLLLAAEEEKHRIRVEKTYADYRNEL